MKKDIQSREDVELLVAEFYKRIRKDDLLGPVFSDMVHMNWDRHLTLMADFWCSILFYSESYEGNPMVMHGHLRKVTPLTKRHFNRWVSLFTDAVNANFSGEKAGLACEKARSIARVLEAYTGDKPAK